MTTSMNERPAITSSSLKTVNGRLFEVTSTVFTDGRLDDVEYVFTYTRKDTGEEVLRVSGWLEPLDEVSSPCCCYSLYWDFLPVGLYRNTRELEMYDGGKFINATDDAFDHGLRAAGRIVEARERNHAGW